jgi:hypothetical protein
MQVRYQAALRPDVSFLKQQAKLLARRERKSKRVLALGSDDPQSLALPGFPEFQLAATP